MGEAGVSWGRLLTVELSLVWVSQTMWSSQAARILKGLEAFYRPELVRVEVPLAKPASTSLQSSSPPILP